MELYSKAKPKTYYKTLNILKNYNKIQKSLQFLKEKLKGLEEEKEKLPKSIVKSNRVNLVDNDQIYYYTDETLENDINNTRQLIIKTEKLVEFIKKCIGELLEEHQEIIKLYYIQKETVTFITLKMNISEKTFYRYRDSLIFELSYLLYANAKINEEYDELEQETDNFATKR